MFSAMRCGFVDFGMTERPCCSPAQHHLSRRLAVVLRYRADDGIVEGAGVLAVAVEGDAADGRPGLGENPVLGAEGLDLGLGEVGVKLDLVDRRDDRGALQQRREVVDQALDGALDGETRTRNRDTTIRSRARVRAVSAACKIPGNQ